MVMGYDRVSAFKEPSCGEGGHYRVPATQMEEAVVVDCSSSLATPFCCSTGKEHNVSFLFRRHFPGQVLISFWSLNHAFPSALF